MFKKALIAEDLDSVNRAVQGVLNDLGIRQIEFAQYCDEAFLKFKKAALDKEPFDLLICDLSFKQDHRMEQISSGEELATLLRRDFPDLKIIINSIEDHPSVVKRIWESSIADAYVCKDRHGLKTLERAISSLEENQRYISEDLERSLSTSNVFQVSDYDINLLKHLSQGLSQDEIHFLFQQKKIRPYSKSSIEKRLRDLREIFDARTNPHLISIVKDMQLL